MIDVGHLVGPRELWVPGFASNNTSEWRTLPIPRGAQMLSFFLVGGGDGGRRPAAGAAAIGGNGGASGMVVSATIPASALPKCLYISIPAGGLGATTNNTAGGLAVVAYVAISPQTPAPSDNLILTTGQNSTSGSAASVPTIAAMDMASLGVWQTYAGQSGGGGTTTNGASVSVATSMFCSAGAGGGGSSGGTGGSQTSSSELYPTITGPAAGANNGADGIFIRRPFISIGGCGGGGNNAGAGGNGGNAAGYGAGGGGGGNGTTTSGNGGNGAPGLLIMRWW